MTMYRSLMALIDRVGGNVSPAANDSGALSELSSPPDALVRAVDAGESFLFAGEELSKNSGMPAWTRFLQGLIDWLVDERAIGKEEGEQLHKIWKNGRPERVADLVRTVVVKGEVFALRYATALYGKPAPLTKTHEALAKIGFCAGVTPNLDPLLERLMGCDALSPCDQRDVRERVSEGLPFVLKLRGVVKQPQSLVLWPEAAMERVKASCAEPLRDLLNTRTMVAIGVTSDDLHRWLEAAGAAHTGRTHYLIASPGDPEIKRKAEGLYRKFHVSVLLAAGSDSPDVLSFLHALAPHKLSN